MQDKIQEIMTLIDGYAASDSINLRMLIESKLRELVREPLSYESAKELIDSCKDDGPMFLLRNVERAHGITNASGVE